MTEPTDPLTFAKAMVVRFEGLLQKCGGLKMIEVDGIQTRYEDLDKSYHYWANRVARLSGRRPVASSIRLDKPGGATSAQQVGPL